MKITNRQFFLIAVALLTVSCGNNVKQNLGMQKHMPDAEQVVALPTLNMPPDYNLRPPLMHVAEEKKLVPAEKLLLKAHKPEDRVHQESFINRIFKKKAPVKADVISRDAVKDDSFTKQDKKQIEIDNPHDRKVCDISNGVVKYCNTDRKVSQKISVDVKN
jgi:hypothetical protein